MAVVDTGYEPLRFYYAVYQSSRITNAETIGYDNTVKKMAELACCDYTNDTECFTFREMTDGRYCVVIPQEKIIRVPNGTDEEGYFKCKKDIIDNIYVFADTNYDDIFESNPGIIQTDFNEYGEY